ncbi:beta-galactosidase [Rathayibacter sp. KR2-224]|uniref:beta-galactosidase n=1 Tax=Rathayibacter sp. KR2-224 TaxID=3400913 RepID=UPI003C0F61E6
MVVRLSRTTRGLAAAALSVAMIFGATSGAGAVPTEVAQKSDTAATHTITFDKYSLMIDGKRTMIWSAEFHYWRLPSKSLWLDVLQKIKAEGYNAVSIYFDWAYHSPKQGTYDFSGVRDVDTLLDMAQQVGLYVIARPGPYINAETDGGGFPGWLTQVAGRARSDAADYLAAADEWLSHIDSILAKHQLTNGGGTIILDQIENELASTGTSQKNYMNHLYAKVRSDGIQVPIFHNDKGRNGVWVPQNSNVPGTVTGPTDLYAFDGYPGGACSTNGTPGSPAAAPDWGLWGAGGAKGGSTASPNTPGFAAEFGGGWFDYWGSVGTYPCTAQREGSGYERVFYGTNIANGLSIQNFYMTYGGTSWGWLPAPVVYTSYDYGAAIDEARQIRPKASTMKELGLFLQSVAPLTKLTKSDPVTASSGKVKVYNDVNPDTGTHLYFAVHNPSNATTDDSFTFPLSTPDGQYTVPQSGTLRLNGQDGKMLVADYDMDGQHLVYSTSEIMTHLHRSNGDLALLYGRNGEQGETVLRYTSAPDVTVLSGDVSAHYDQATGDLRLDYTHSGLAELRITGGGRSAFTLLLADQDTADTFWHQDTAAGPALERGPELVRAASIEGTTLKLSGDTKDASDLQVWAPDGVSAVTWNGAQVATVAGADESLSASTRLPGADPVDLPDLTKSSWSYASGTPEADPGFDDSSWTTADKTSTTSTTKPPTGAPVLTADDYGFHQGDVWYRGTYTGSADTTTLRLNYGGGGAGMLQTWLDGVYLGQNVLASGVSAPPTTGTAVFAIPQGLRTGKHVLAVMVRNDGHNEDGGVNDAQKEGRGLIGVTTTGGATKTAIEWKIQGDLGGESVIDTARGLNNVGGQYGERKGWYLPGFPDQSWPATTLPASSAMPGTTWYRTSFSLNAPKDEDPSLGLTIGDSSTPRSGGAYRALIYVNGWNVGQYIADVGPQHTFVLPNGILDPRGHNTVAIAVTSDGGPGNALESVRLVDLGTVRGGVPLAQNEASSYSASVYGSPKLPSTVTMDSLTSDVAGTVKGGSTLHLTGVLTNHSGAAARLSSDLDLPDGWTSDPSGAVKTAPLTPGSSATLTWTVQIPQDAASGSYAIAAENTVAQANRSTSTGRSLALSVQSAGEHYVSDLPWDSSASGWGTIGRDVSVGGGAITVGGTVYAKGIGVNSISTVTLTLPSACTTFSSVVGLDAGAGGKGSVTFQVYGDGTLLKQTSTIAGTAAPIPLVVDITGVKQLTLTVGDAGDGNGHDNADWADAKVECAP